MHVDKIPSRNRNGMQPPRHLRGRLTDEKRDVLLWLFFSSRRNGNKKETEVVGTRWVSDKDGAPSVPIEQASKKNRNRYGKLCCQTF